MKNNIYDFIVVGAGAAGCFVSLNLPKDSKKLLIEKNNILAIKVLMSGGERANLSNIDINPEMDYFSCNRKFTISPLKRWTNYDTINFFESNGVATKIEDRGRVITASGHARDVVKLLVKKVKENQTKILTNTEVLDVEKKEDLFFIKTGKKIYKTQHLVVSVGGRSYPQVGTVGFGYKLAEKFNLSIVNPYKGLVGVITKEDLSLFSGTTIKADIKLKLGNEIVYEEYGPLLFTHWGLSGPIIYNLVLACGEKMSCKNSNLKYKDFDLEIGFDLKNTTKKLKKHFGLDEENNKLNLKINDLRSWKEAKVTGGGINTNELTKFFESKKVPGLFFIGEVVDVTGKTGGFNLQWAWSSAYCCAEKFKN